MTQGGVNDFRMADIVAKHSLAAPSVSLALDATVVVLVGVWLFLFW